MDLSILSKNWGTVYLGLYDVAIGTVTGILLYVIVRDEAALGFIVTTASVLAMIASLYAIPILKKFPSSFWVGSIWSAVSIIVFALNQSPAGVWAYILISCLTVPLVTNKFSTVYFRTFDQAPGNWRHKYHLLIERDVVLGVFRTLSYVGLFIFLGFGTEIAIAKSWLLFLPIIPIGIGLLIDKTIHA